MSSVVDEVMPFAGVASLHSPEPRRTPSGGAIGDRNAKPKLSGAGQSVVRKLSQGTRLRTAANPAVAGLPPPSQGRGLAPEEKRATSMMR
jgi:hypothetical protein